MKELVEAIRARGVGVGTEIVKVDMFLNHRLDTDLFVKMGRAFADAFAAEKPDLVLTVEASGHRRRADHGHGPAGIFPWYLPKKAVPATLRATYMRAGCSALPMAWKTISA